MLFQKYIQKNLNTKESLPFDIPTHKFKKGAVITDFGDFEHNIYYVVSGIVESYINTRFGEKIVVFTFANGMVSALSSVLKKEPSKVRLKCLKDCKIQLIPFDKLREASKTSIIANRFYSHFLEEYYLTRIGKAVESVSKTAEESYLNLIKNKSEIIKSVPLGHIAIYLGIHPNSLSRIRKKYAHTGLSKTI